MTDTPAAGAQIPPAWAARDQQIDMLTKALSHMPHPGRNEVDVPIPAGSRRPFAEVAYAKGVRIFPNLAEVETVVVADSQLGPYAPARTVDIADAKLWKLLHDKDPDLYERVRAAETPQERAALAAEIAPSAREGIDMVMSMLDQIGGDA